MGDGGRGGGRRRLPCAGQGALSRNTAPVTRRHHNVMRQQLHATRAQPKHRVLAGHGHGGLGGQALRRPRRAHLLSPVPASAALYSTPPLTSTPSTPPHAHTYPVAQRPLCATRKAARCDKNYCMRNNRVLRTVSSVGCLGGCSFRRPRPCITHLGLGARLDLLLGRGSLRNLHGHGLLRACATDQGAAGFAGGEG